MAAEIFPRKLKHFIPRSRLAARAPAETWTHVASTAEQKSVGQMTVRPFLCLVCVHAAVAVAAGPVRSGPARPGCRGASRLRRMPCILRRYKRSARRPADPRAPCASRRDAAGGGGGGGSPWRASASQKPLHVFHQQA